VRLSFLRRKSARKAGAVPMPPEVMRALVGTTDVGQFDNPTGGPVFPDLRPDARVFDLGCGCGRIARQLIQQRVQPAAYVGADLHPGMIRWAQENLTPVAPQFRFVHHDVENPGFNPGPDKPSTLPLPGDDAAFDLVLAWSVFTHLRESQVPAYLHECRRLLAPGGVFRSTWFLFDKAYFPMMQTFQNALYINENDLTNAVIFDRAWFQAAVADAGLVVAKATPPTVRGFAWLFDLRLAGEAEPVTLPLDEAPLGSVPPPVVASPDTVT
jgi:SAM-dependent methyltransferase